ncbi:MAG: hypothetical protein ACLGGX_08425 [Bdellovibrionia bacterium]
MHRKLDARLKILGFEIMDLMAVFMLAAVSNLLLGQMPFAPVFIFLIPTILAVILYFAKRNKPEGYLVHLLRYISTPGLYSAGEIDTKTEELRRKPIVKI